MAGGEFGDLIGPLQTITEDHARKAKEILKSSLAGNAKIKGIGLTMLGRDWAVQVNTNDDNLKGVASVTLEDRTEVPVVYKNTGNITKR